MHSTKLRSFTVFVVLVFAGMVFSACSKPEIASGASSVLVDMIGNHKAAFEGKEILLSIVNVSDGDKGVVTQMVKTGQVVPGQIPDWFVFQPIPVAVNGSAFTFTAPVRADGTSGDFTLARDGSGLKGSLLVAGKKIDIAFLPTTAMGTTEIPGQEDPGMGDATGDFSSLGLEAKFATAFSDPLYLPARGVFKAANAIEGDVILDFDDGKGKVVSYHPETGGPVASLLYEGGVGPVDSELGKPFVIQYRMGKWDDPRGGSVDVRVPVSAVRLERGKYADFGIENAANLYQFIDQLQEIVRAGNPGPLLDVVGLPLVVNGPNGDRFEFATKEDVKAAWKDLFNGKVRAAVLGQKYDSLFVNANGVMIGSGELWFGVTKGDEFVLTAVNPF